MTRALAAGVLFAVLLAGVLGPLTGYDPVADVHLAHANVGPGAEHWLGTDHLGRDVFMRALLACRWFVLPGSVACAVAAVVGIPAGALAGWYGGGVEAVIRFAFTVVGSVPRFVLILLVLAIYGDAPRIEYTLEVWRYVLDVSIPISVLSLAAGLSFVPLLGEAVRARIEELRTAEYVLASRAHGLSPMRILAYHLVWAGARHAIARQLFSLFGYFVVLETTLSYIGGFGVQQPEPSWGNMLVFGWADDNPWSAWTPIVLLIATVAAIGRFSDAFVERQDG
jgi:peptide/nickel transport system permease protein